VESPELALPDQPVGLRRADAQDLVDLFAVQTVKPEGFEQKVGLFVLACSLNFLW